MCTNSQQEKYEPKASLNTLRKIDDTITSSILETMNTMLDHLITDDGEEENLHIKNIRKIIAEQIYTRDDAEFIPKEIKQRTERLKRKKATVKFVNIKKKLCYQQSMPQTSL